MKKKLGEWAFAAILTALLLFLAAGLTVALERHGIGSSETAGWVQAIGAIVAISVAIYIPSMQRQQEQHDKDRDYWNAEWMGLRAVCSRTEP